MADNTSDFFSSTAFRRACEDAIQTKGITKKSIASALEVTPTTLSSLLGGRSTPSMNLLSKMVEFFGGELVDFLEMPPRNQWTLKHYRVAAGLTQAAMARELDVAASAVSSWELGKYAPKPRALAQMSQMFAVPVKTLRDSLDTPVPAAPTDATLTLAETLAETVLGFAARAADVQTPLPDASRAQMNSEIRGRAEQALALLATLIPQLPEESRARAVGLVRRLSEVHEKTISS
ncbi:transcriptional regulator [Mycobacteroides chelonae]|uniref:helix-turn-helix domain-containing protein n=1 Tax=Mycobacteroides chelonae TaxID=1774 RepID=UPI0008A83D82|nr:helix-turn-helix domain-containing protein [Mycobacteroides chelonae]OHT95558.1 transcriptional regulator [Mycobacteroides chelonae]